MDQLLSLYTPQTLTHAINKIMPENLYLTSILDKKAPILAPTESVIFDVVEGRRDLAPMGHPGDPAIRVDMSQTFKTYTVTPPQIFMEDPVKAADVAGRRMAGQSPLTVGTGISNPVIAAFNQYVAQKQKNMTDSIARRIEWMWSQLLTTGKIAYTGPNGRRFTVDCGLDTANCVFDATLRWDGATAATQGDPLLQLQQWRRLYAQMNGFNPSVMILGTAAADAFRANTSVKNWLRSPAIQYMQMNIGNNADLVTPVANIPGVGQLVEHSAVLPRDGSTPAVSIPENVLIMTSPEVFQMHYGAIYDFDLPGNPLAMVPRFSKMKDAHDGKTKSLFVESHPLPVLVYDQGIMVINVTTQG